jgi:hypothetical protein
VSIQTLKKQFQKELKTNPKKAGVLGLLALVAVYFWVPLAMKMVSGKKRSSKSIPIANSETPSPAAKTANGAESIGPNDNASPKDSATPAIAWDQLLDWISKDPLMASRPVLKNDYDPFKHVEKVIEIPELEPLAKEATEQPEVVRDLSPAALGMTLSSTIVGNRRSVAMIDERAYTLGQRVLGYDGAMPLPFRLVKIRPELVILERDRQQYVLKISQTIGLKVEDSEGL